MEHKKGFSIIAALAVLFIVTAIGISVQFLINSGERGQRLARINFVKSIIENRIRLKLSMPESYVCTQLGVSPNVITSCSLDADFWSQFSKSIPGTQCVAGVSVCGIEVTGPLNISTDVTHPLPLRVTGITLNYNDKMHGFFTQIPENFSEPIEVPSEAITNSVNGVCSTSPGYLFKGIQKDGTVICDGLPSCAGMPGFYFAGLDKNAAAICKPLAPGISFDIHSVVQNVSGLRCPAGQYLESINFDSNLTTNLTKVCKTRKDPCEIGGTGKLGSGKICPDP